jgi:hypothetical protein
MAQVALVIDPSNVQLVELIKQLRVVAHLPVNDISDALATGRPVFVRRLFDRNDRAFSVRLLSLLDWLEYQSLDYKAYQVLDHEIFENAKCGQYYVLNATRLRNLLTIRNQSVEQQINYARASDHSED